MQVKELKLTSQARPFSAEPADPVQKNFKPRLVTFLVATASLALCFSYPLYRLLRLVGHDDLYTDIPLVPLLSLYLIWVRRDKLPRSFEPAAKTAAIFIFGGLAILATYWLYPQEGVPSTANFLAANVSALLLLFGGICFRFLGMPFMRTYACPMALLIFTVPLPVAFRQCIETLLQHGSAVFAGLFFRIAGDPVMRHGINFRLPDMIIQVAPECSGIHSSLVLTIVSIAGGWLYLRSPWKRTALILAVIPLALARNGFRIFVIARLCMAYGPQMLNAPIHRHGGPLFFALSLIPFFLLLFLLRRTERPILNPQPDH